MSFGVTTSKNATEILHGDGWWCDLAVKEFLDVYRLPHEYGQGLVADHLALARLWAVKQLFMWRVDREAEGFTSLADVSLHGVPGAAQLLYKRAVFCHAKALLLAQYATVERRDTAKNDAKESPETADRFYAWAQNAITDLLGQTRIMVESL